MAAAASCNATVAFAFLARDGLPLWPAWERFLAGCASGSYTVHVHAQRDSCCEDALGPVGGVQLPPNETEHGDLRFRWALVRAQFALFRRAARTRAPNGCVPRWVHTASDSCAPMVTCAALQRELTRNPGASYIANRGTHSMGGAPTQLAASPRLAVGALQPHAHEAIATTADALGPPGYARKSPIWTTVWAPHADELVADETAIEERWLETWGNRELDRPAPEGAAEATDRGFVPPRIAGATFQGGIDEYVWPFELQRHGYALQPGGKTVTMVTWAEPVGRSRLRSSHPVEFATANATRGACERARRDGYLFARKFAPSIEVQQALVACLDDDDAKEPPLPSTPSATAVVTTSSSADDPSARCARYLEDADACAWTEMWSCPGSPAPGTKGRATVRPSSVGFYCCCVLHGADGAAVGV